MPTPTNPYPVPGEFDTAEEAVTAAALKLIEFEESQPSSESGGQDESGIQDRVFIVRPDGSKYRFVLPENSSTH